MNKPKSIYVVMKVLHGWQEQWDIHCVCVCKKLAQKECNLKNSKAIANKYFVKRAPYIVLQETKKKEGEA